MKEFVVTVPVNISAEYKVFVNADNEKEAKRLALGNAADKIEDGANVVFNSNSHFDDMSLDCSLLFNPFSNMEAEEYVRDPISPEDL